MRRYLLAYSNKHGPYGTKIKALIKTHISLFVRFRTGPVSKNMVMPFDTNVIVFRLLSCISLAPVFVPPYRYTPSLPTVDEFRSLSVSFSQPTGQF